MRHIIIGGSIAGLSAAQAIRAASPDADITMFSDEKIKAYYRPLIPLLLENREIDVTVAGDPAEQYRINSIYDAIQGIDHENRNALSVSGEKYPYDRLLIATGSSPSVPDIKGLKGSGVFPLRTLAHAYSIKEYAKGRKNAVVLGGGFVGTKAAVSLQHAGFSVTIIEKLDQILFGRLDSRGSQIIARILEASGISLITGDTIAEIVRKDGMITSVLLSSGRTIAADFVVIAAGSLPNIAFLQNSGIKTGRGVLINESLQTSVPDIFAAGDVVEYTDLSTGRPSLSFLWTNAEEMGRIAGKNMAGTGLKYRGFLSVMNSTEIFGIPVISIGLIEPEGKEYDIVTEDSVDSYRKLVFQGDLLVGAIFIGDIVRPGIYTNLIKNKIPAGEIREKAISGDLSFVDFMRPMTHRTAAV